MKKLTKKIISVILAITIALTSVLVTVAASNECPLDIEITTNKEEYGTLGKAKFVVEVTNKSNATVENVSAEAVFDELDPFGFGSEISAEDSALEPGETLRFEFKATLDAETMELNFIQRILLKILRFFHGDICGFPDEDFDDGRAMTSKIHKVTFGKYEVEQLVEVWYEGNKTSVEEYFEDNSQLIDVIEAEKSDDIMTEAEVKVALEERGFVDYPITYEHSINGNRCDETEILEDSAEKHPMYQTIYLSKNGEAWILYVINGKIFANPVDFNLESDLGAQLLVSESQELTSYDEGSNKFYITIPFETECLTIPVDRVAAETLDELTIEKICDLTGATVPETENDENAMEADEFVSSLDESVTRFNTTASVSTGTADPFIVVSLGDSYSSGEGIEPFYGQEKSLFDKVEDQDWLAHRSKKSWPSLLKVPGVTGTRTMSEFRVATGSTSSENIQWFFGAVSGAETKHFKKNQQKKEYSQHYMDGITTIRYPLIGEVYLPKQLDIFSNITGDVDYVTLTVGGNDVGFVDIVTTCVTNCAYLSIGSSKLEDTFSELWSNFDATRANIKKVYEDIRDAAGPQATIIVAGYPKLLDKKGKGTVINKKEATLVNSNVSAFNDEIEKIVNECRASGMNIYFVDVEAEFDKDGGHQAYSSNAWINKVKFGSRAQDLKEISVASAYSVHPNAEGAKAYARCVNAKIAEIESSKNVGTLSGKICKASDRITPITDARIRIEGNNSSLDFAPDSNGNYSKALPVGTYQVKVTADGYIDFNAYATVEKDQTVYMETFLLVEGDENQIGTASGKVINSLSGSGVENVNLIIKQGWNNINGNSGIIATTQTTSEGNYTVDLNCGNYTVIVEKEGFVTSSFNIIVQNGTTPNQNGTITPIISGDDYLITLTWGANPRDLDSHVVGKLSNGNDFHVYYGYKSQMDGSTEVCNLDYDDTSSYGPEHITLKTNSTSPYYYYIYRFAGDGTVASSGAKVTIHQGNTLIGEFNVPTNLGSGDYWNVFAIKDGELIINNTITSSANTTYAN